MQDNNEERTDRRTIFHTDREQAGRGTGPRPKPQVHGGAMSGFTGGYAALLKVRAASKEHAAARSELKKAESALAADRKALDHRISIHRGYDAILAEQSKELDEARAAADAAASRIEALQAEHEQLAAKLSAMRAEHAEALRPYQNVMESTRGRADDTSRALGEAKKAAKGAQSEAAEAQVRRDQRISAANKALDNAQARLRKLEADYEELRGRDDAEAASLARMKREIEAEKAHLEATKADIPQVTSDAQKMVDEAQRHLWAQQQALEAAEKAAEEARLEAKERKAEYDARYQDYQTEEATLDNDVVQREIGLREAGKERDAAQARIDAAQALIDEAEDIHSHPETTQQLADSVAEQERMIALRKQEVTSLARSERKLRESTRKQRITFIALLIVIVTAILFVIWLIAH